MNRAVRKRFAFVGDHAVDVEIDGVAKTLATRTRAVRAIKREKARLRFLIRSAAFLAFEAFVEHQAVRRCARSVRHEFKNSFAAAFTVTNFNGVHQARSNFGPKSEPVHHHVYRLREIYIQQFFRRREFKDAPRLVQPVESALSQSDQRFANRFLRYTDRFARPRYLWRVCCRFGSELQFIPNVESAAGWQGKHTRGDFVERVSSHVFAAAQTKSVSDPGKQQPQVVVNLSCRCDGAPRIARGVLLPDGNGRSDSGDLVDVRLFNSFQELSRVSRERFDIPPLTF